MIRRFALSVAALVLGAGLVLADDSQEHVHDHSAKHGGLVEHTTHHHLELVAEGATLALYLTHEDGAEQDTSAATASATVLADGKAEQVALSPAGGNLLKGSGAFNAGAGTIVVVSLALPGHAPAQVRFELE